MAKIPNSRDEREGTGRKGRAPGRRGGVLCPGAGKREREKVGRERDIYPPLTLD